MRRYAARTDKNQQKIIDAYRDVGAWVWYIGRPFDLLVGFRGRLYLVEVKNPKGKDKIGEEQHTEIGKLLHLANIKVHVVRGVDDGLRAIGAMRAEDNGLSS